MCQALRVAWGSMEKGVGSWLPGERRTSSQGSQHVVGGIRVGFLEG